MEELVASTLVVIATYLIIKKLCSWKKLPPGPWGLPLLGYLPFIDAAKPHVTLTKLAKKYGPIYSLRMGSVFTVVLSDHKLVREAFAQEAFSGRAPLYLTHGIMHGNGIICAEGPLWKDQRKLVTSWLKAFGMTKHGGRRAELECRIRRGTDALMEILDSVKDSSEPTDLAQIVSDCLGNIMNDLVFGFTYPPGDDTWAWLRHIQEEGCKEIGVAGVVNFLPFVRHFSKSIRTSINMIVSGQKQSHRLYLAIVNRRRKMLELCQPTAGEDDTARANNNLVKCVKYGLTVDENDFHYFDPSSLIHTSGQCVLDYFLLEQERRNKIKDGSESFTSDKQLLFLLADLFGAGLDTTSVTLGWFFMFMALHQDEQDLIRAELIEYSTSNSDDDELELSKLPRLSAAVCETQRIRSIVPVGIPHGSLKDMTLAGYTIPAGSMVIPLQWAIHMDGKVWNEPEEFRPSRFLDDKGNILKPQEFIPFQTGKRMCPGDELSRMLAAQIARRLLRARRVRLASAPRDLTGRVGVTLAPPALLYVLDLV